MRMNKIFIAGITLIAGLLPASHGLAYTGAAISYNNNISVDGDLSDWSGVHWNSFDTVYDGSPTDITDGAWAAYWCEGKIYVAVKVKDSDHYFTDGYNSAHGMDAVEIYIHTTGSGHSYQTYQEDAQQWTIGFTPSGASMWSTGGTYFGTYTPKSDEFQAAGCINGDWLYYEAVITPYQYFASLAGGTSIVSTLYAGMIVGLDVTAVGHSSTAYTGTLCSGDHGGLIGGWNQNYSRFAQHTLQARPYTGSDISYNSNITVDGNLSDWSNAHWSNFDTVYDGNPTDIVDGGWAAYWSEDKVYVAAKVKDTDHFFANGYAGANGMDAVNFYIHTIGSGHSYQTYQEDAQEWTIGFTPSGTSLWSTGGTYFGTYTPKSDEFQAAGSINGDWLYYEAAITPYQYFAGQASGTSIVSPLYAGMTIGLDVTAVGHNSTAYTGTLCSGDHDGIIGGFDWDYNRLALHPLVRMKVAEAKRNADSSNALLSGAVTAVFGDDFYVESLDRSCGIRVRMAGHGLSVGKVVNIKGTAGNLDTGERYINATNMRLQSGSKTIDPLGFTNKALGGGTFGYQQGIAGASGLNNIGLLVKTSGRVTSKAASSFTIDDGAGVSVKVIGAVPTATTPYVTVTGISSCDKSTGNIGRVILATSVPAVVDGSVFDTVLAYPCFRSSFQSHDPKKEICVKGFVGFPNASGMRVRAVLKSNTSASSVLDYSISVSSQSDFVLRTPITLPPAGDYTLTLTLTDMSGRNLATTSYPIRVLAPASFEVTFDENHICYVNGQAIFPIGLYHTSSAVVDLVNTRSIEIGLPGNLTVDAMLQDVKDHGFNTVFSSWGMASQDYIQKAQNLGLFVMPEVGTPTGSQASTYVALANQFNNVLMWYGQDEISDATLPAAASAYKRFCAIDPHRPVSAAICYQSQLKNGAGVFDFIMTDPYIIMESNTSGDLASLGDWAQAALAASNGRCPLWGVPQGFVISDFINLKLPTAEQLRCQAYEYIAHGATGLIWYSYFSGEEYRDNPTGRDQWYIPESTLWPAFKDLNIQLNDFTNIILHGSLVDTRQYSVASAREISTRIWDYNGYRYILAVNAYNQPIDVRFSGGVSGQVEVVYESRTLTSNGSAFIDHFEPFAVHIYKFVP